MTASRNLSRPAAWVLAIVSAAGLAACGSSSAADSPDDAAGAGAGGSGGVVLVEWGPSGASLSQEGTEDAQVPGLSSDNPAGLGTAFEFMGWRGTVSTAEITTQPNESDASNPVSVVVQMTLEVTAPSSIEEQEVSPFEPAPIWKALDMVPCPSETAEDQAWEAGETREIESCHYMNVEELGADLPDGAINIRYADFTHVTTIHSQLDRGQDY